LGLWLKRLRTKTLENSVRCRLEVFPKPQKLPMTRFPRILYDASLLQSGAVAEGIPPADVDAV
jgi:hypothetical protein